jgi:hypothetical protein
VAAAVASSATSQAPPAVSDEFVEAITLTADRPVVARHLSWSVAYGASTSTDVRFAVSAWEPGPDGDVELSQPAGISLTVVPDEASRAVVADWEALVSSTRVLDLSDACARSCRGGATVIVRLADESPSADTSRELRLEANLVAYGEYEEQTVDARLTLFDDPERAFDGRPSVLVVRSERTVRVSTEHERAHRTVVLVVDADALQGPLAFPLVGRAITGVESVDASGHPNAYGSSLTVGGDQDWHSIGGDTTLDLDWLSRCRPSKVCKIPLRLDVEYDAFLNADDFEEQHAPPGWVEVRWFVELRLEAFDGRVLPVDGLAISRP